MNKRADLQVFLYLYKPDIIVGILKPGGCLPILGLCLLCFYPYYDPIMLTVVPLRPNMLVQFYS